MRIALVTETFYPAVDGVTTTIKAVADRMIDAGHEVRFVAPGPGLPTYRRSAVARISPIGATGRQVRDALDVFAPEAVVAFDPGRLGRRALAHARVRGQRTLVVQQSPMDDPQGWAAKVAAHADEVLVTSRWLRDGLARHRVPTRVWLPGVDTAAFTPALRDEWLHGRWSRAKTRGTPLVVVGYAGGLAKPHGVRRLAALRQLPGIRPVIIGDGPQRGWLEQHLPQAKFVGPLGTGDLAVALATLDVLVHPGEREGCGHTLREAAASGVPVVAPRAGAAAEIVRSLETGLLYDPADERGLLDAVAAVAADPHRALLGARARDLARTRPWPTAADDLIDRLTPVPSPVPTPR